MNRKMPSEAYSPPAPHVLNDAPIDNHYDKWNYSIGYEVGSDGQSVPEDGNTAVFRIYPQGLTEPVYVTKPQEEATFTVNVLSGTGRFIRSTEDGQVDEIDLATGSEVIVHPGEAYCYENTSDSEDLILHDVALPAFESGDDVELTASLLREVKSSPRNGQAACVVKKSNGEIQTINLPVRFFDLLSEAASK